MVRNENAAEVGSARIRCMNAVREWDEITMSPGVYALAEEPNSLAQG